MYEKSKDIFFSENVENAVCRVKSDSDFLFLLPATEDLNNRVVQKPQFLNNFPEKNREFAAICGKFSRTWERTARFLNKSNIKNYGNLKYFPELTHFLISYIRKDGFAFAGLNYANKLNTLELFENLSLRTTSLKKIENLPPSAANSADWGREP